MQIVGKTYLNNGNYMCIAVNPNIIIVRGDGTFIESKEGNKFTDNLNDKTDNEIVRDVVDYFLNNNKLAYISNESAIGIDGKKLIYRNICDPVVLKRIVDKYLQDRFEFTKNNELSRCTIDISNTSSGYNSEGKYVLAATEDSVHKFRLCGSELKFINDLLNEMYADEIVCLRLDNKRFEISALYNEQKVIKFGETFDYNYLDDLCTLVSNHNQELSDRMTLSMKKREGKNEK